MRRTGVSTISMQLIVIIFVDRAGHKQHGEKTYHAGEDAQHRLRSLAGDIVPKHAKRQGGGRAD